MVIFYLSLLSHAYHVGYVDNDKYPSHLKVDKIITTQFNLDGTQEVLADYKGLISDENVCNVALGNSNDDFSDHLEYEQECELDLVIERRKIESSIDRDKNHQLKIETFNNESTWAKQSLVNLLDDGWSVLNKKEHSNSTSYLLEKNEI